MIFCCFCEKPIFVNSRNQKIYFKCDWCPTLEIRRSSDNEKISYFNAVYESKKDITISKEIFIENEKKNQKKFLERYEINLITLEKQREELREKEKRHKEELRNFSEIYTKIHDHITLKNLDKNFLDELKKEYRRIFDIVCYPITPFPIANRRFYPDINTICNGFANDNLPRLLETYFKEQDDFDHISKNIGCGRYFTVRNPNHDLDEISVNIIKNKNENETASNYLSNLMYQKITVVMPEHNNEKFIIVPVPNVLPKKNDCCAVSLAKKLSTKLGRRLFLDILKKKENLVDRKWNKTPEERFIMAKQNYAINNCKPIKNQKILLVDDLYWGGSTMDTCSQLLIQNGARHVMCFSAGTRY